MTAQEKWKRLTNPKTVEDYGLSMTEGELLEFDEGRKLVESMRGALDERMNFGVKMVAAGHQMQQTMERVSYGVLTVYPLGPDASLSGLPLGKD